jgi:replicative DNA helicase
MPPQLKGALEDNVLTALCWSDQHAANVSMQVPAELFATRAYREIAEKAIDHLQRYNIPPKGHLRDLLEDKLRRGDEGILLKRTLDAMEELQANFQPEFVLEQLQHFIAMRKLSMAVEQAADALNEGDVDKAREALFEQDLAPKQTPGIWLNDPKRALSFLDHRDEDFFSSDIDVLDDLGVRPRRKTLTLMIAAAKRGKSTWLVGVGKRAILHHQKALHITLENSEELTSKRYTQALFAMAADSRDASIRVPVFKRDSLGRCLSIEHDVLTPEVLRPEARKQLGKRLSALRGKLLIKEFPTSTLTIAQLNAYLDVLERAESFIPDLLIIDYPDLMAVGDVRDMRVNLGKLFAQLRGIGVARNMAVVAVTQGNRSSDHARTVTAGMVAEDWSKIGTADTVLTYSQTSEEKEIGLARVLVAAARDARDKYVVMISQSYATCQFCIDSVYMSKFVESEVDRMTGNGKNED